MFRHKFKDAKSSLNVYPDFLSLFSFFCGAGYQVVGCCDWHPRTVLLLLPHEQPRNIFIKPMGVVYFEQHLGAIAPKRKLNLHSFCLIFASKS